MTTFTLSEKEAATLGGLLVEAGSFASAQTERPILNAVLFTQWQGYLRLVATDSYQLSVITTTSVAVSAETSFLVELAGVLEIGKALAKLRGSQEVTFAVESRDGSSLCELVVTSSTWSMRAYVIDGEYPHWEALLPDENGVANEAWPLLTAPSMARLGKLALGVTSTKYDREHGRGLALQFTSFGTLKPLRVTASTEHAEFYALIMPVRL